jgi:hypothetical protein
MVDYLRWCEHYQCNPETEQARTDYAEYRRQLDLFADLVGDDQPDQLRAKLAEATTARRRGAWWRR